MTQIQASDGLLHSSLCGPIQRRVDQQFILASGTIQGLRLGVFDQNLNKLQNKPGIKR